MSDISVAIFAASYDAALHDHDRRGDLAQEIMRRAHWLREPRDLQALTDMSAFSGGLLFGQAHLDRLREKWHTQQQ